MSPTATVSLQAHLAERSVGGRKLLLPYVTAGITPDWLDLVEAVIEAGADAVEIGIPFSDPAMDGTTIQEASVVALDRGTTPAGALTELRTRDFAAPLIAMTYYNLVNLNHVSSEERAEASNQCVALRNVLKGECWSFGPCKVEFLTDH